MQVELIPKSKNIEKKDTINELTELTVIEETEDGGDTVRLNYDEESIWNFVTMPV